MRILYKQIVMAITLVVAIVSMVSCETTPSPIKQIDSEPLNVITPLGVGDNDIRVEITSRNDSDEYIVTCVELALLEGENITTSEQLVSFHNAFYAEQASAEGVTLKEYLENNEMLLRGNRPLVSFDYLYPDTEYAICCYGVDFNKNGNLTMTTAIAYDVLTTTAPDLATVKFKMSPIVDGHVAMVNIEPSDYDGSYYCYFIAEGEPMYIPDGKSIDGQYCHDLRNTMYDLFRGFTEAGLLSDNYAYHGNATLREELNPDTNYMAVCFSVNNAIIPVMSSKPTICRFRTLDSQQRMVIDISVTGITPYEASLVLTPSKDTPYACVFLSWDQYPFADENNDMLVMEAILTGFMPAIFEGVHSEMLTPLMPNTEYVVVAFGTDSKVPTSDLFTYRFTTPNAIPGTNSITGYEIHKVFDAEEIATLNSDYRYLLEECACVVVAEVYTEEPTDKIYWWWYDAFAKEEYTDEAFLEDLLMFGYTPKLYLYGLWYDEEFIFAGIVEDEDGNLSDINYSDVFVPTREQCSPAEEFFSYVNAQPTRASSVVIR